MKFDINSYAAVLYVDKTGADDLSSNDGSKEKPFLTIEFARSQAINNTVIMIGEGEFEVTSLNVLSNNMDLTYYGCGEDTVLIVSRCGGNFGTNTTSFYKMVIKPSSTFTGDTRFINYSDEQNRVNFYNVAFMKNGNYPSTCFLCISSAAHIEMNKYFYNCSFIGDVQGVIATSFGHFINCATSTSKYFVNGYDTDTTSIAASQLNTSVKSCEFNGYKLTSHDNKSYGVYSGDNAWIKRLFIIKENNKYYSIKPNKYVDGQYVELSSEDLQDFESVGFNLSELTTEITVDEETFKPINKFSKIKLVSNTKFEGLFLKSIKSNKQLIVASNNFSSKVADHIDYFKCIYEKDSNSLIKLAFSIDNGVTWKGNNFENLSIEIPLKPYSDLTEEERTKWNTAKETIATNGIDIENLESIDFNSLDFEYIRFAYVLYVTSADDVCNTTKLQWQFDAKGSMQLMDSSEIDIEVLSDSIKVTPKTEEELIKVNITNGTCSSGGSGSENLIESISVNGTTQTITNKNVDITVPTKTSDLTNDSNFVDNTKIATQTELGLVKVDSSTIVIQDGTISANVSSLIDNDTPSDDKTYSSNKVENDFAKKSDVLTLTNTVVYTPTGDYHPVTKKYVDDAISAINGMKLIDRVNTVSDLPSDANEGDVYYVGLDGADSFETYVKLNNGNWLKIGITTIDMNNYYNKDEINSLLKAKISICNTLPTASIDYNEQCYFNIFDRCIYQCILDNSDYKWNKIVSNESPIYKSNVEPTDKTKLWLDTSDSTKILIKTYDETNSAWITLNDIPIEFIKNATYVNNKLTLIFQDDTTLEIPLGSATGSGSGFEVYTNYSLLPTTDVDDKTIVYCEEDYEDVDNSVVYKKGFYEYKEGTGWELINVDIQESNTNGNIEVNGTDITVYDDTEIKERISPLESLKIRTVAGEELDYGSFSMSTDFTDTTENVKIPFDTVINGNIEAIDGGVKLQADKTYDIYCKLDGVFEDSAFALYDATQNKIIRQFNGYHANNEHNYQSSVNITYKSEVDTIIEIRTLLHSSTFTKINGHTSQLTIIEIGRTYLHDPVKFVNDKDGIEDAPVGHIMSFMGKTAPKHYLTCDGKIYNIADYPKLAEFIEKEFGAVNYFGGDGITTFAVPDLRGEFLRGYDPTNIRDPKGSTRGIGKHQDATKLPQYGINNTKNSIYVTKNTEANLGISNKDSEILQGNVNILDFIGTSRTTTFTTNIFTTRPTNVNVLYCIKYEPTYYMEYHPKYGYIKEEVLFEGRANTENTEYILKDSILNFDKIEVYSGLNLTGGNLGCVSSRCFSTSCINFSDYEQFDISEYANSEAHYRIGYTFTNQNTLKVFLISDSTNWNGACIYKIVGIKCTEKTLSNLDVDSLTTEQINKLKEKLGL